MGTFAPVISIAPSNSLTLKTERKDGSNRFLLFTSSWLHLQSYIESCLQLPINKGDFVAKYGDFALKKTVDDTLAPMTNLVEITNTFGNPTILKERISENPNCVFTSEPPSEIYGHIVWLAMQIQHAANTFNYTFANLNDLLDPSMGTPQVRAQNLKDILVGRGGLVSTADDMRNKTAHLLQKLTTFDKKIGAANDQMLRYLAGKEGILAAAEKLVGEYKAQMDAYETAANESYALWKKYTIAASVASVTLFVIGAVLTAFQFFTVLPVGEWLMLGGVAAATGLGIAAKKARDAYDEAVRNKNQAEAEQKKKLDLVNDLKGLNSQIGEVAPALQDFATNLGIIEGVWLDIGGRLAHIATTYSVEQLSNLPWVTQAFQVADATHKWKDIQVTAQEFTQTSLVSYRLLKFGDPLPEVARQTAA